MAEHAPLRPSLESILCGLFARARDRLSEQDLLMIERSVDGIPPAIPALGALCEAIFCLVGHDSVDPSGSGAFRDTDAVLDLAHLVSEVCSMATAQAQLAVAAGVTLELRRGAGKGAR